MSRVNISITKFVKKRHRWWRDVPDNVGVDDDE